MTTTMNIKLHVNLAAYTLIFNCDVFKFRISKDIRSINGVFIML